MKFLNLQLFANANTQNTSTASLSDEMKTYYEKRLLDNASPKLVHDQFADKYPIPKNGGKTIELRKFSSLPKATTPLTEGVTPDGQSMTVTKINATVDQYGNYVTLSDVIDMTAIDPMLVQATKLNASQAARTLDTVTREVLNGGTNVIYCQKNVSGTMTDVSSRSTLDSTAKLSGDAVFQAAAVLSSMNADTIDGSYIGIIHPYAAYDLMRSTEWIDVHKYADPEAIYNGEIGKLGNVRFVDSTEAKVFKGEPLTAAAKHLTVKTAIASSTTSVAVNEAISATEATALAGRKVYIGGTEYTISSATAGEAASASLTLSTSISSAAKDASIVPTGGASDGGGVFSTMVVGAHAYATTDVEGGGLQTIIKPNGSGEDPLNQRSTAGWKAIKVAERLSEEYMVRIESCGTYSQKVTAN